MAAVVVGTAADLSKRTSSRCSISASISGSGGRGCHAVRSCCDEVYTSIMPRWLMKISDVSFGVRSMRARYLSCSPVS